MKPVFLVQGLCDGKGLVHRKIVMNITVLLEGCQIVQERSLLEYLPSLHFSDCYHRSGVILLYAASAIFLSLNSFVWMNCRCPLSLFSTICNCQYGVETKLRFSLKRAHIMARVGVCTRPMELFTEPEAAANARLAFMPTSQSAFALLSAAAYRLSYPVPSLRLAIPHGWPRR